MIRINGNIIKNDVNSNYDDDDDAAVVAQSPVEISGYKTKPWTPNDPLIFDGHWHSLGSASIMNNGRTAFMTFNNRENLPILSGGPLKNDYIFEQLHFHWSETDDTGSEHSIDGKKYAAEAHLVHYNSKYSGFEEAATKKDGLAVTGFLLKVSPLLNTAFNPLSNAVSRIPQENQSTTLPTECLSWMLSVNLNDYFTYQGSLTTEPYLETVTWIVYKTPIDISLQQMRAFRQMEISDGVKRVCCNARPLQSIPVGLCIREVDAFAFKNYKRKPINMKSKL